MEVQKKPSKAQNLLAIDFGKKFIGVAISSGILASPLLSLGTKEAVTRIPLLIKEHQIDLIVVGLPQGPLEKTVRAFAAQLSQDGGVPVVFTDETLTSFESKSHVSSQKHDEHAVAAALILERYLAS